MKCFQRVSAGGGVPLKKKTRLAQNRTVVLRRPKYSQGMDVTASNHDQPKREQLASQSVGRWFANLIATA